MRFIPRAGGTEPARARTAERPGPAAGALVCPVGGALLLRRRRRRAARRRRRGAAAGAAGRRPGPGLHAQLGHRLAIEPPVGFDAFLALEVPQRGLGLRAHHTVHLARIVSLVLERLLDGPDLLLVTPGGAPAG